MSDKIVLGNIASFQNDSTAITQYNANNAAITAAINNTLSRDGTSPNQMSASLDMNGNAILNTSTISASTLPGILRYTLLGVNLNTTNTDTAFNFVLPAGFTRWAAFRVFVNNASTSLTNSTIGLFTGAGGTGQTIAANQALSAITQTAANVNANILLLTSTNANSEAYSVNSLFLRTGTAQGSPATADIVLLIQPLS